MYGYTIMYLLWYDTVYLFHTKKSLNIFESWNKYQTEHQQKYISVEIEMKQ